MALTQCGECGRKISDKASACPNCGAPQERGSNTSSAPEEPGAQQATKLEKPTRRNRRWLWIVFGLLIVARFVDILSPPLPSSSSFHKSNEFAVGVYALLPSGSAACPSQTIFRKWRSQLFNAEAAHDHIGEQNADTWAALNGCWRTRVNLKVLVIRTTGFMPGRARVRFSNGDTAWVSLDALRHP